MLRTGDGQSPEERSRRSLSEDRGSEKGGLKDPHGVCHLWERGMMMAGNLHLARVLVDDSLALPSRDI